MNAWIFQSNPDRPEHYRINDAVRDLEIIEFSVSQCKEEIKAGDRAYIWQAGKKGGLIAAGTVLCDPEMAPHSEEDNKYYGIRPAEQMRLRVLIRLDLKLVNAPITRKEFTDDSILRESSLIKMSTKTNFKVKEAERQRIEELITKSSATRT